MNPQDSSFCSCCLVLLLLQVCPFTRANIPRLLLCLFFLFVPLLYLIYIQPPVAIPLLYTCSRPLPPPVRLPFASTRFKAPVFLLLLLLRRRDNWSTREISVSHLSRRVSNVSTEFCASRELDRRYRLLRDRVPPSSRAVPIVIENDRRTSFREFTCPRCSTWHPPFFSRHLTSRIFATRTRSPAPA